MIVVFKIIDIFPKMCSAKGYPIAIRGTRGSLYQMKTGEDADVDYKQRCSFELQGWFFELDPKGKYLQLNHILHGQ